MEQVIANGRIPRAKKEASLPILRELGVTTSDLINAAYDYLLAEKQLPVSRVVSRPTSEAFSDFVAATTLDIDWSACEGLSYKDILQDELVRDYERLA